MGQTNVDTRIKMTRKSIIITAAMLATAACCLYARSTGYGFVYYDDIRILRDHPELYGKAHAGEALRAIFVDCFPREEPLLVRDLSWAFDSLVFGFPDTTGYHLGNVFLHGLVVALLFLFLLKTTGRVRFSVVTTILFMVLGIHVEPVTWIMGRKDLLSGVFMLLALCAQAQRLSAKSRGRAGYWYGITAACLLAGLLSKISVLTFPAVLYLHAVLFPFLHGDCKPDAGLDWRRALRVELPLLLPLLGLSLGVFVWYRHILTQMGIFERNYSATGIEHLWNLVRVNPLVWWVYLKQVLLPTQLTMFYTWPDLQSARGGAQVAASLATLLGVAAFGFALFRRRKDLLFYYLAYFVFMIPYMNIMFIGIWVADRYLYLSSFCILAICVNVVSETLHGKRRGLSIGLAVASIVCIASNVLHTIAYQPAWRDGESLWRYHMTLKQPSVKAFENLAAYYYATGIEDGNAEQFATNLGKMSVVVDEGIEQFKGQNPASPSPITWHLFFLRAIVQEVRGMPGQAIESLLISDRLRGGFDSTSLNLAMLYRKLTLATEDPAQRAMHAQKALERYNTYIKLAFRGRTPPLAVTTMLSELSGMADTEGEVTEYRSNGVSE